MVPSCIYSCFSVSATAVSFIYRRAHLILRGRSFLPCMLIMLMVPKLWAEDLNPTADKVFLEVRSISLEGFSELDRYPINLKKLQAMLVEKRSRFDARMSVDQLHLIADELTAWVRAQGYSFHTIFLPPQKVEGGNIKFEMQEGRLVDVNVVNLTRWQDESFAKPFKALLGDMLYAPDIETAVHHLKAQSGIKLFAFFSRGERPGEAILNVRVEEADKRSYLLKAENYGSEAVGEHRVIFQYSEFQLLGFDRLSFAALQTLDGGGSTYGSVNYKKYLMPLNWSIDLSFSNNQFSLGEAYEALDYQGDVQTFNLGITRYFQQKAGNRKSIRLGYYSMESDLSSALDTATQSLSDDERSAAVMLDLSYEKSFEKIGFVSSAGVNWGEYSRLGSSNASIENEPFTKYNLSILLFNQLSKIRRWSSQFKASFRGQYSDAMLPGIERSSLTGAYSNRAFDSSLYSADTSYIGSIEWSLPGLFMSRKKSGSGLFPFFFYDWSWGEKYNFEKTDIQKKNFEGLGLGLQFAFGKHVAGKLSVAKSLDDGLLEIEDEPKVFFEIKIK